MNTKNFRTAKTINMQKPQVVKNIKPTIKQWTDLQTYAKIIMAELELVNNILAIPQTESELNNSVDINSLHRNFATFEQKLIEMKNNAKIETTKNT